MISMDVTIFFNTKRKWFLAIGQLIFTTLGGYMFLYPALMTSNVIRYEFVIRAIGAISLLYFGLIFLLSIKIYYRSVALVITKLEIIDSSTVLSMGSIPWINVADICQIHEGGIAMIKISLINPDLIIDKEKNFIKKLLLKRQNKRLGSPIIIPMIALNSYVDTLERQLKEGWEKSKRTTHNQDVIVDAG